VVESKKFLQDYSELFARTNRADEAQKMLERANRL